MTLALAAAVATGVVAVVDWYAVWKEDTRIEYVAKPATLGLLALAVVLALPGAGLVSGGWLVAALLFSLAGDVFLMLKGRPNLFVAGLASFLVGHLCYLVYFVVALSPPPVTVLVVGVVLVIPASPVAWKILQGSRREHPKETGPVVAYIAIVTAMVVVAVAASFSAASLLAGLLLAGGAVLFWLSDMMIGIRRFIRPFAAERMGVIVTYHLGQFGIIASQFV